MRKVEPVAVEVAVVVGLSISYFIYLLCLDDTMKVSTSKKKKNGCKAALASSSGAKKRSRSAKNGGDTCDKLKRSKDSFQGTVHIGISRFKKSLERTRRRIAISMFQPDSIDPTGKVINDRTRSQLYLSENTSRKKNSKSKDRLF